MTRISSFLIALVWTGLLSTGCQKGDDSAPTDVSVDIGADTLAQNLIQEGIDHLNTLRTAAGLTPVVLDPELSQGCAAHVEYMLATGHVIHREDPSHPRYTEKGAQAGMNATLTGGISTLEDAIDAWFQEVYHRLPLLHPGLTAVGAATAENHACLDVFSAHQPIPMHSPIAYPGDQQSDIPTTYPGHGAATPLPEGFKPPTGFIISLMLSPSHTVDSAVAVVEDFDTGEGIAALTLLPQSPLDPFATFQQNAILVVPHKELSPKTTYRVTITGSIHHTIDDEIVTETLEEEWRFKTAD